MTTFTLPPGMKPAPPKCIWCGEPLTTEEAFGDTVPPVETRVVQEVHPKCAPAYIAALRAALRDAEGD